MYKVFISFHEVTIPLKSPLFFALKWPLQIFLSYLHENTEPTMRYTNRFGRWIREPQC